MTGMNLHSIIKPNITSIVPDIGISLLLYNGYINDAAGNTTPGYIEFNNIRAQVQLENRQTLTHLDTYNESKIYKRFYILSDTLTGINRNINTGGDYIIMNGLYYKIVEVKESFKVGWICVVGAESSQLNG